MEKKVVLVDVDDTINRMQVSLLRYVNSKVEIPYRYRQLTSSEREGNNKQLDELAQEFLTRPDLVVKTQPYPTSLTAVKLLFEQEVDLHVVSSRKEPLHGVTKNWLEKYGFTPYITDIHDRPTSVRGPEFKVQVAKRVNATVAFDDTKSVAEALVENNILVFLIRRPWNKELQTSSLIKPYPSFYRAVLSFLERL